MERSWDMHLILLDLLLFTIDVIVKVCILGARFHIKVILKSERQKPLRNTHIEKDYLWVVGIIRKDCWVNQIDAKSYHCQRFCLFIFTTQHLFMIDL